MKIGDIVTKKVFGENMQFCVLGFYTNPDSGNKVAILALLDPNLILESEVADLCPVSLKKIFGLTMNTVLH